MPRKKKATDVSGVEPPAIVQPSAERRELLQKVMNDINKKHGATLMKFANEYEPRQKVPTGVEAIDQFLGGGMIRGNVNIVWGGEGVGKSTLAMCATAAAQKAGLICCYIDMERTFDQERAKALGVDVDTLVFNREADTAEDAMNIVLKLCREKVVDFIVIDSIQAMSPKEEQFEGKTDELKDMAAATMALLARKMTEFLRRCAGWASKAEVGLLLIGQLRVQGLGSFIVTNGLTGGNALKHWSVLRLYMRRGQRADAPVKKEKVSIGNGKTKTVEKEIGFDCVLKMEKTKITGSAREGEDLHIPFLFETGFAGDQGRVSDGHGE